MLKTALVTGGTSGIGRATACLLATKGYRVFVNGRNGDRARRFAEEMHGRGLDVRVAIGDVTKSEDIESIFHCIRDEFSTLDVLVNNAGGARRTDNFFLSRPEDLVEGFRTNFFSAFLCSQKAAGMMNQGVIINVGSVCGHAGSPVGESQLTPIYSSAKAALHNLTQNLAKLLAPNIRVNAVIPGYTATPLWGPNFHSSEQRRLSSQTRIQRFCTAEEIADVIAVLATNEGLTGCQIVVDGGLSLGGP